GVVAAPIGVGDGYLPRTDDAAHDRYMSVREAVGRAKNQDRVLLRLGIALIAATGLVPPGPRIAAKRNAGDFPDEDCALSRGRQGKRAHLSGRRGARPVPGGTGGKSKRQCQADIESPHIPETI